MKTLTELSGSLIRTAAAAIADARRSLPKEEKPAEPATVEVTSQPAEGAGGDAAGEAAAVGAPAPAPDAPAPVAAPPVARPSSKPAAESEAVKAALDAAVAKATGLSGDRLAMLRAAVEAAGRRVEDVRLVRVFGLEEQLRGAQVIGERQYVVDLFPQTMKQDAGAPGGERGRGGGRRGGGRGGGGDRGAKGSASGGFSMDAVRDDRKSERGGGRGRPGGRPPGGRGPAGSGGPGGPPGGGPKK